jgi:hypothetical protein
VGHMVGEIRSTCDPTIIPDRGEIESSVSYLKKASSVGFPRFFNTRHLVPYEQNASSTSARGGFSRPQRSDGLI